MKHRVGIVGLGFVGTAVETGLQAVAEVSSHDKFKPTDSLATVVERSNIIFVCVPTPMNEDGSCNTSIVESVVADIDKVANGKSKAIVIKSTVPPGTTWKLQQKYQRHTFAFNPEFLTEKNFINDFLEQDRIIIGIKTSWYDETNDTLYCSGTKREHNRQINKLYEDFAKLQKKPAEIVVTSPEAAEMLKYATNCFLSTKVAFFNEIHQICQKSDVKYDELVELISLDKRIGQTHLKVPGPDGQFGFGGSCFPKDLNGLIAHAKSKNVDPLLLESVWAKNLVVRDECDWEKLPQVTGKYGRKKT